MTYVYCAFKYILLFFRYALKVLNDLFLDDKECLEINNLKSLNHPNIIKYIDSFVYDSRICILVEYHKVNFFTLSYNKFENNRS